MTLKKILLPTVIVIATVLAFNFILANPPEAQRGGAPKTAKIVVETQKLEALQYHVQVESYGVVKPRTQSILVAQVSGQIISIAAQFREGGFFEQGEVLAQIDDRDHLADVKTAQANVLTAQQTLLEEEARAQQAFTDWQRLGNGQQASNLVLRKPQLEAAKAKVLSAQAALEKSQLNLERTKVIAPYAGRVLSKNVDVGQVVSNNSQLAEIYATDKVEIRLPIKNKDLELMDLPEQFRGAGNTPLGSPVLFHSDLVGEQNWQGNLVRTEGAIDTGAQQLYVVAQINDPYKATATNKYPIKIGQYVKAQISGRELSGVLMIPNATIYQGSYVYIVEQGVLKRKDIVIRWQNSQQSIIASGLEFGQQLVLTPLGQVSSGTAVSIKGQDQIRGQEGFKGQEPRNDGAKKSGGANS
ncbi:efflux RND transporter periplasmic adaptor subunit [Paraglaciecola hydrolytica]|uniref:Efflux transporter periplasmic adaptor subunit n=1 Tax=Paraglaciecola hydrolytica TaxID=1799789 RepID=A0A136A3X7_9ALTE|nr:efflux RND transporter periplasmic adaptor subunit [Paraglaciecola hydrolytica]KXI29943.1 efflux transporter periplasmic adaptor subunit [Paraglaciecola hydrolytica]